MLRHLSLCELYQMLAELAEGNGARHGGRLALTQHGAQLGQDGPDVRLGELQAQSAVLCFTREL